MYQDNQEAKLTARLMLGITQSEVAEWELFFSDESTHHERTQLLLTIVN